MIAVVAAKISDDDSDLAMAAYTSHSISTTNTKSTVKQAISMRPNAATSLPVQSTPQRSHEWSAVYILYYHIVVIVTLKKNFGLHCQLHGNVLLAVR